LIANTSGLGGGCEYGGDLVLRDAQRKLLRPSFQLIAVHFFSQSSIANRQSQIFDHQPGDEIALCSLHHWSLTLLPKFGEV